MVSEGLRRCATEDLKRQMSEYSLGIDIGGTFTDLVIHDHDSGRRWGSKVLTTHDDPQRGVVAGVRTILAKAGSTARHRPRRARHDAVHQRADRAQGRADRPADHAGFRDTLEIGRERKYELYDLRIDKPAPLVPRHLRLEVSERMRADGSVPNRSTRHAPAPGRCAARRRGDVGRRRVPARLRQPGARGAGRARHRQRTPGAVRHAVASRWRRRSASTSAPPPRSPTPTSSRWPRAISPRWRANWPASASRRRCC